MASIRRSWPAGRSHSTRPVIVLKQVSGAVPSGIEMLTRPETVFTAMGPSPLHSASIEPLTVRALKAPATRSKLIEPDIVLALTAPAVPPAMRALTVLARHLPVQLPTRISADIVRRSAASAASSSILPLIVVTETSPRRPSSRTEPECVPTITSVPAGQRTSSAPEPRPARSCMMRPPSSSVALRRSPRASTSSRGSPMTSTLPERDWTRRMTATGSV